MWDKNRNFGLCTILLRIWFHVKSVRSPYSSDAEPQRGAARARCVAPCELGTNRSSWTERAVDWSDTVCGGRRWSVPTGSIHDCWLRHVISTEWSSFHRPLPQTIRHRRRHLHHSPLLLKSCLRQSWLDARVSWSSWMWSEWSRSTMIQGPIRCQWTQGELSVAYEALNINLNPNRNRRCSDASP